MPKIQYLDPAIANEGERAGSAFVVPKMPHVWDYAPLKEHEHYGIYFAPKPFQEWPAIIYNHKTGEEKRVENAKEAFEYGVGFNRNLRHPDYEWTGEWQAEPPKDRKPNVHTTGKTVVGVSAERSTADSMTKILQDLASKKSVAEPTSSGSEDVLALLNSMKSELDELRAWKNASETKPVDEKEVLIGLAAEKNIHVDKRWGLDKIKAALDDAA